MLASHHQLFFNSGPAFRRLEARASRSFDLYGTQTTSRMLFEELEDQRSSLRRGGGGRQAMQGRARASPSSPSPGVDRLQLQLPSFLVHKRDKRSRASRGVLQEAPRRCPDRHVSRANAKKKQKKRATRSRKRKRKLPSRRRRSSPFPSAAIERRRSHQRALTGREDLLDVRGLGRGVAAELGLLGGLHWIRGIGREKGG